MGKNSFDYKYTCPDIDKQIDCFKSSLSDRLDEIIEELNPMFYNTSYKIDYRRDLEELLYNDAEQCFEGVRKTNEDMRKEAEHQIDNLTDELEEQRGLVSYWESEAEKKDREIEQLKSEI